MAIKRNGTLFLRCFRMRKSCCPRIAISQAGIAAQTLTLMQGFERKIKECNAILHSQCEYLPDELCTDLTQAQKLQACTLTTSPSPSYRV